jgi:hypothetical protein
MTNNFIVPPLGAKGRFKFVEPFNKEQYQNEELRVSAIRTFKELKDSSIDVYELIYQPVGLTENDLLKDVENNIPIVVLESQAGKYLNIPANKIKSLPDISGIKYQQRMLVANLGLLPLDFNIDTLYKIIKDDVYDVTGIQTEVKDIKSSGIVIIDEIKDKEYMKLLDNKRTVNLSYRTRYYKLKDAYDKLLEQQSKLEDYIKRNHQS